MASKTVRVASPSTNPTDKSSMQAGLDHQGHEGALRDICISGVASD